MIKTDKVENRKAYSMDDEQKFWLGVIAIVVFCVSVILIWTMEFSNKRTKMFIDAGYTRKCVEGYSSPQWIRPEKQ
jgi:hypothetical protein